MPAAAAAPPGSHRGGLASPAADRRAGPFCCLLPHRPSRTSWIGPSLRANFLDNHLRRMFAPFIRGYDGKWLFDCCFAPSSGDLGGWDSSTHGGGGGGGGGGFEAGGSALQRSVSRLFQERVQYFAGVTFQRGSILAGGLLVACCTGGYDHPAHVMMVSSAQGWPQYPGAGHFITPAAWHMGTGRSRWLGELHIATGSRPVF